MATPKKKTAAAAKQEMQAAVQTAHEIAEERREAEATPAQRIEQRATQAAVASADALSLGSVAKDQAEQIKQLTAKLEKAYGQVQEVAVRAIEGASQSKAFAGLQQALVEQGRKGESKNGYMDLRAWCLLKWLAEIQFVVLVRVGIG